MTNSEVFELLAASGPFPEDTDKLQLYGQFVGAWDISSIWYNKSGVEKRGNGTWQFTWILGGRGIQDVLFSSDASSDQYGTTLRCYDSVLDAWHISWMQPAGNEYVHLLGRQVENRIVQEGCGTDQRSYERWSFVDITAYKFTWLSEVSYDQGRTWFLEQEMHAARRMS
jgi:hypothetical protein